MTTIADLEAGVLQRLEEDVAAPIFWSRIEEVRPALVEALNEATLLTGEPEVRAPQNFVIVPGRTLQVMPPAAVAIVRIEGPEGAVRKDKLADLGAMDPAWRQAKGNVPKRWFPFGLTQWGVYPQLLVPAEVRITTINLPVAVARPYRGTEAVPFQNEFLEAFEEYAAHILRLKESGAEFSQSIREYDRFLLLMQQLSKFAVRKSILRFSRPQGPASGVNDVTQR